MNGQFEKGKSGNPSGKKPGTLNKDTREIKDVINHLVKALNDGKLNSMLEQLLIDKPEAVLSFLGKIAPKDLTITGDIKVNNPIAHQIQLLREEKSGSKESN